MGLPRILLVTASRRKLSGLLRARAAARFEVCGPEEANQAVERGARRLDAVVWHVAGRADRRHRGIEAISAAHPELPLIAVCGRDVSCRDVPGCRVTLPLPLTGRVLAGVVRREAEMLRNEAKLARASATSRIYRRRLSVLSDIAQAANSVLEPRKVMEIIMSRVQDLIHAEAWSLLLVDEKDHTLSFELLRGERVDEMKEFRLKVGQGVPGWVVQYKRPLILNDVRQDARFDPRFDVLTGFRTRSIMCAPLISRGRIIGAVEMINKRRGDFTKSDLEMITTLVEPGAIAIENAILYQKSAELTVTDDLTKLFNSRYLNVHLRREIKRSRRYGSPVSLIFLDLDGFKRVNDQHGHLAGSRALFEVGRVIQRTVREIDVVSRYGGDEFTIILPQTGATGAMIIADRIRSNLEESVFLGEMGIQVRLTASFGVATFPDHGQSREDLIQKADQAMYRVKGEGKNGVALALQDSRVQKGRQ